MNETSIRAREIIQNIQYANVATVSEDGDPWNTPVLYLFNNQLQLIWFSDKSNQHSQNIRSNNRAFITIYNSTVPVVPVHNCKGVYLQVEVEEINDLEAAQAALEGNNMDIGIKAEDCIGDAVRRIYRATPKRAWMNGAEIKEGVPLRDFRVEISLEDLTGLVGGGEV